MPKNEIRGASFDAIILAIVRLLTTFLGLASTSILSRTLSLMAYGTYSQANLVISMGTSLSILGMTDGINYFFNRSGNKDETHGYVNTLFTLQSIIGIGLGVGILIFQKPIIAYFQNAQLAGLFIYIAFRPLISNFIAMLQVLQVSIGRAKAIAYRNAFVAIAKLCAIVFSVKVIEDIRGIFIILLLVDVLTVVYFAASFSQEKFVIAPVRLKWDRVIEIAKFCIPMGLYVLTNSLSRDLDKMVIGRMGGTEELAIYTNCSALLPVDIISAAFLTVIIPIMTRYVADAKWEDGKRLFSNYLQQGYLTTVTFSGALIVLSREVILFLYGEAYLAGQMVFVLYMVVDMLRFANLSLVLSANGESTLLMKISIGTLIANLILNILLYSTMGFVGPAVATVVVTLASTIILLWRSTKILHSKLSEVLVPQKLLIFLIELLGTGILFYWIRGWINRQWNSELLTIILSGGGMILIIFFINAKRLFVVLKQINQGK